MPEEATVSQDPKDEAPREPVFQTRIFIEPDGSVVFENLSEDLLELALALDPDAVLTCAAPLLPQGPVAAGSPEPGGAASAGGEDA